MNITAAKTKFLKGDNSYHSAIMIIGDEAGYIHKWDLSPVIKELRTKGFKDILSICKYQLSFNPKKNAQINALTSSKTLIFFA